MNATCIGQPPHRALAYAVSITAVAVFLLAAALAS